MKMVLCTFVFNHTKQSYNKILTENRLNHDAKLFFGIAKENIHVSMRGLCQPPPRPPPQKKRASVTEILTAITKILR